MMRQKGLWKKRTCCCLAALLLMTAAMLWPGLSGEAAGMGSYVTAPDWPAGPEVASEGAVLIDATTGTILYEKNVDQKFYPASITKIMTALLAIENCALDDVITYTDQDIYSLEPGASSIALRPGEQLTVEESLYGLLLASGNDCANGLAHQAAGNISAFVDMMNEKAAAIGCTNTHFTNPHGLHDENHYTTPHDMALIMRAALQNATYLRLDSTKTHFIPETNLVKEKRPVKMRHEMLDRTSSNYYEGVVAGKTGYTSSAGNTLVTYAVRDNMKLICVVMRSIGQQYSDTKKLLDYGFSSFQMYPVSTLETRYSVSGSQLYGESGGIFQDSMLSVAFDADSWAVGPKNAAFEDLESELVFHEEEERSSVGTVIYRYEGMQVGQAGLRLVDAGKENFPFSVRKGFYLVEASGERHINVLFLIGLSAVAALFVLIVWVLFRTIRGKRKKGIHFKSKGKLKFR